MESCTVVAARVLGRICEALACRICNERQKDPKSLACQHSFCAACLEGLQVHVNEATLEISCPSCCRVTTIDARAGLPDAANLTEVLKEAEEQERYLQMGQTEQHPCRLDETDRIVQHKTVCEGALETHRPLSAANFQQRGIRVVLRRSLVKLIEFLRSLGRMLVIRPRSLLLIVILCLAYITIHPMNRDSESEGTWTLIEDSIPIFGEFEEKPTPFAEPAVEEPSPDNKQTPNSDDINPQLNPAIAKALSRLNTMSERVEDEISQLAYEVRVGIIEEELILRESLRKTVGDRRSKIHSYEVHLQAYSSIKHADELGEDFRKFRIEAEAQTLRALHNLSFVALRYRTESTTEYIGKLLLQNNLKFKQQFYTNGIYQPKAIACYPNGDVAVLGDRQVRVYQANGQYKAVISSQHLREPSGLGVTDTGNMYITDGKTVKVFDDNLKFVFEFTPAEGHKLAQSSLTCVAVTSEGHVVVCDRGRQLITIHNSTGALIKTILAPLLDEYIAVGTDTQWFAYTNANSRRILSVDQQGMEVFGIDNSVNPSAAPAGIACDEFDDIYVVAGNTQYSGQTQYLGQQAQPGRFNRQQVADHDKRYAVQRYSQAGTWLGAVQDIRHFATKALAFGVNGDLLVTGGETVYIYTAGT